jgi:hypothetical protein
MSREPYLGGVQRVSDANVVVIGATTFQTDGRVLYGPAANRPAANVAHAAIPFASYYAVDTQVLTQTDGAAWVAKLDPAFADGIVSIKGRVTAGTVVIANGASLSGDVALGTGGERQLVGIQMPAAWTAASLTFAVSSDGVTFVPLYWDGAEYVIAAGGGAAASLGVSLEPSAFAGWPFVRVRSGTVGVPVNQGAERTLVVLTRAV